MTLLRTVHLLVCDHFPFSPLSAISLRVVDLCRLIFTLSLAYLVQLVGQIVDLARPNLTTALRSTPWTEPGCHSVKSGDIKLSQGFLNIAHIFHSKLPVV